jgi:HEPN domain-containing protein
MLRRDFQVLAGVRVREAKALAGAELYDGAYYLGGLAVECALKSAVAKATQRYEFPDRKRSERAHVHNLQDLLRLAGLEAGLNASEDTVRASWATVKNWNVDSRYQISRSPADVLDFLDAVAGRKGVLRWLKLFW